MSPVPAAAPPRNAFREQQWREAHERYLDCARRVFAALGYPAATVADIVEAANGSRATFYAHFRDKADIAACLFERVLPEEGGIYHLGADFPGPAREQVRAWLDEHVLQFWTRYAVEIEVVNHAMAADPRIAARHYQWIVDAVCRLEPYLARWRGEHEEAGITRACLLVLQLERLCYHWLIRGVRHDRETVLDILAENWCRELRVLAEGPS
ncbi:TetR/AcrR family transcriptional regulator [Amycolatopsis rhizosphaerae]|uniref:TetR/AcrR family transcriptional regulator n=1 Tax=Amycolatopsis rhizosphaerae TaxID=2053003 RepID=A0A558AJI5_9PSEU|nr:TetR/AcrR family transcriptional regulator [Amycolatopsis rhizosphaerae]TVT24425.1 TetR/AcrR family transcriptional regulator [Amycolatopsis rhizosphaerae]